MNWESILEFDDRLSHRMRVVTPNSPWRPLAAFLAHSGDSWFWLAGLGLVWLFGTPEWHTRATLLILSMIFLAVMVLAISMLIPKLGVIQTGYRIGTLKQDRRLLLDERQNLLLEVARLESRENLEQIAGSRTQPLVKPAPGQIVHLGSKADGALALNVEKQAR